MKREPIFRVIEWGAVGTGLVAIVYYAIVGYWSDNYSLVLELSSIIAALVAVVFATTRFSRVRDLLARFRRTSKERPMGRKKEYTAQVKPKTVRTFELVAVAAAVVLAVLAALGWSLEGLVAALLAAASAVALSLLISRLNVIGSESRSGRTVVVNLIKRLSIFLGCGPVFLGLLVLSSCGYVALVDADDEVGTISSIFVGISLAILMTGVFVGFIFLITNMSRDTEVIRRRIEKGLEIESDREPDDSKIGATPGR